MQLEAQKAAAKASLDQEKLDQEREIKEAEFALRASEGINRDELEGKRISSKERVEGAKLGVEIMKEVFDE